MFKKVKTPLAAEFTWNCDTDAGQFVRSGLLYSVAFRMKRHLRIVAREADGFNPVAIDTDSYDGRAVRTVENIFLGMSCIPANGIDVMLPNEVGCLQYFVEGYGFNSYVDKPAVDCLVLIGREAYCVTGMVNI